MSVDFTKEYSAFFHQAADAAGQIALKYFRQDLVIEDKADTSPVTKADREIESTLRDLIHKNFPSHGIIGEEYGRENEKAEFVWVLDPIDGTKSFITGRPLFGTIIGLAHQGRPMMGLVDQAFTKERWVGVSDAETLYNGRKVSVAKPKRLEQAQAYTYILSRGDDPLAPNLARLRDQVKLMMYNSDCYAYTLLAMGCVDLAVEHGLAVYDVAGIVPIIKGAGGYVADWHGREVDLTFVDQFIAASTQELAEKALEIMQIG